MTARFGGVISRVAATGNRPGPLAPFNKYLFDSRALRSSYVPCLSLRGSRSSPGSSQGGESTKRSLPGEPLMRPLPAGEERGRCWRARRKLGPGNGPAGPDLRAAGLLLRLAQAQSPRCPAPARGPHCGAFTEAVNTDYKKYIKIYRVSTL